MGSITDTSAAVQRAIQLPVIDISNPTFNVGKEMLHAATKYGFLYINPKGTGFDATVVDRIFNTSRDFFTAPDTEDKTSTKLHGNNLGWLSMQTETLDPKNQRQGDFKESFNIGEFYENGQPQQRFPEQFRAHSDEIRDFMALCKKVCDAILNLLSQGLEVEEPEFFTSRHKAPSGTTLRFLHYPTVPMDVDYNPDIDIRAGAHSDFGSMTLLFQRVGQPGLEIKTPDNTWAPVKVIPDGYTGDTALPPILVNIADCLSYWTNGLLKSTVHRVIFPDGERRSGLSRFSMAYFYHPANATELVPIPSPIVREAKLQEGAEVGYGGGATAERAMTAQEHLVNRLEATYGFRPVLADSSKAPAAVAV